jgi:GT2 family glycosyltransferase
MNDQPIVSVVIPVYNAASTVEAALRSVLNQTYRHLEVVVVDDGSSDGSITVVESVRDHRIAVIRQKHRGLVEALRVGCERARGTYVARLDADDHSYETRIAAQVAYLEHHHGVGLVGCRARFELPGGRAWLFAPPQDDNALRRYLLWDNPFVHSSVMFRRDAYVAAGGYSEGPNEDYRLWIQIARSWKVAVLPEALVIHRIRPDSLSRTASRTAALRNRFRGQWEAAVHLGPWYSALPALAATCGAYALALAGLRQRSVLPIGQ